MVSLGSPWVVGVFVGARVVLHCYGSCFWRWRDPSWFVFCASQFLSGYGIAFMSFALLLCWVLLGVWWFCFWLGYGLCLSFGWCFVAASSTSSFLASLRFEVGLQASQWNDHMFFSCEEVTSFLLVDG
ncbi:hypothetical protein AtNW77_Chr5g0134231 [Arabidopsis thaliana]